MYDGPITICEFRNQCFEGTDNCDEIAICTHVDQIDPRFLCTCPSGYDGDGTAAASGGSGCTDIDECATEDSICAHIVNSECNNIDGSFQCNCITGYSMNDVGTECVDNDECASDDDNDCPDDSTCNNNEGSYECVCNDPLHEINEGDGFLFCHDINECFNDVDECVDEATCTDTLGAYLCTCPSGYTGNGFTIMSGGTGCSDINECVDVTTCADISNSECNNIDGSFQCNCVAGYYMNAAGTECGEID